MKHEALQKLYQFEGRLQAASSAADIQAALSEANEAVELAFHGVLERVDSPLSVAREAQAATISQRLKTFNLQLGVSRFALLVEYELDEVRMLTDLFAQRGIVTDQACTAREALERMQGCDYGLVIIDKELPDMRGPELLRRIRQGFPMVEVVMITRRDLPLTMDTSDEEAYDYLNSPFPSMQYVGHRVEGSLARHEFEVRIHAMIDFLKAEYRTHVEELETGEQALWLARLKVMLDAPAWPAGLGPIAVQGAEPLWRQVERLGYQVLPVASPEELFKRISAGGLQGVVLSEEEGGGDVTETVQVLQATDPDLAVFVLAREPNLKKLVDAFGVSLGDCLVRPLEERDVFQPRLRRLLARRERVVRDRRLIEDLKRLTVDLCCAKADIP